jgi:DNA repair protein RecO
MTRAGVAYYEREHRELVRLNFVEPDRSPLSAPAAEALGYVGYFAELIDEWAPDAHADERLYRLGSSVVDALAAGVPVEPLARYFEYWLLKLQGVYPSIRRCPECAAPLAAGASMPPREAALLCARCAPGSGTRLSPEAMAFLAAASTASPEQLGRVPFGPRAAKELEAAHRRLMNVHLEKELKSARVLREMRLAR